MYSKNISVKALFVCLIVLMMNANAFAQKKIYENPKMKTIAPTHKIVAILPFAVTIKMAKLPKGTTQDDIIKQQKAEATNIQNSVYTYLLRKSKKYTLSFQDVSKTNVLLKKAGITDENITEKTMDELAKLLEVDAVIGGTIVTDKPISEGAALAKAFLFGFGGKTSEAKTTMTIHNAADEELLWRYDRIVSGGLGSSTDDMVEGMMRQIARNFRYDK